MKLEILYSYYALRCKVFIHHLGWDLPTFSGLEIDQYDIPKVATYVVAHENNKVVAGLRLMPCDTSCGNPEKFSYMIRDAYLGRLTMPSDLCRFPPPTKSTSWELTRLVSVYNDPNVILSLMSLSADFIRLQNGNEVLCLSSPALLRLGRKAGYDPTPLGKIVSHGNEKFLAHSSLLI